MAIRLSGTPQQQKAPFSAFDKSSGFQSGLTQVGQALQQVGAGQARIAQRAKVEAERAKVEEERTAAEAKRELEKKQNAAQDLAIFGASSGLEVQINQRYDRLEAAITAGDVEGIRQTTDDLKKLDPKNLNLNDYRAQGTATEITDEAKIQRAVIGLNTRYQSLLNKSEIQIAQKDVIKGQLDSLNSLENRVLANNLENPEGNTGAGMIEFVDSIVNDEVLAAARSGATNKENFDTEVQAEVLMFLEHQFAEGTPITEDQLEERRQAGLQIFSDYGQQLGFGADQLATFNKLYQDKLGEVTDVDGQKELAKNTLTGLVSDSALLMEQSSVTNAESLSFSRKLQKIDDKYLTGPQRVQKQSLMGMAAFFARSKEQPTALAYQILQHLANQPNAERKSFADVVKEISGSELNAFNLQSTEQSKLSDWMSENIKRLNAVGENPENLKFYSPQHAELIEKIKSQDPQVAATAYKRAQLEYQKFIKNPNIKGAPSVFYVEAEPFPTGSIGSVENAVTIVKKNLVLNDPQNVLDHAESQLAKGNLSGMELLNFTAQKMAANSLVRMERATTMAQKEAMVDSTQAQIETLFSYYKSGTETSAEVNKILAEMRIKSSSYDFGDFEQSLPLQTQIDSLENLGENSRVSQLETIFKGFIKKDIVLLRDMDKDDQYEHIRKEMREQNLLIPKIGHTPSGFSVELPIELSGHISEKMGERGNPLTRATLGLIDRKIGNKESLKNVSVIYATAGLNQIHDQYGTAVNLRKFYEDLEERVPNVKTLAGPQMFYSLGTTGAGVSSPEAQLEMDQKAWVDGMLNNVDENGRPLARFSAPVSVRNPDGTSERRSYLLVLTNNNDYVKVPASETDKTPISFSVSKATRVVDRVMPQLTDVFANFGNPDTSLMSGFMYYVDNALGFDQDNLIDKSTEQHDIIYRGKPSRTEKYVELFGMMPEQKEERERLKELRENK